MDVFEMDLKGLKQAREFSLAQEILDTRNIIPAVLEKYS
jgi:hypothetical protein